MSAWRTRRKLGGAALGALLLAACAPTARDPWGLSVARGGASPAPPPPATVQADVGLLPRAPGAVPVSARLYAEPAGPGPRYRLDVFGFPALVAASWVWADGGWLLVRHDRREARRGAGDALEAPDLRVRVPDVHAALGFLWGAPLPGFPGDDSARAEVVNGAARNGGTVRWTHAGEPWEAHIDPETGLCLEARSPGLAIRYSRHALRGERVIAGEAELFADGESLLVITVREWRADPVWARDPFGLVVPEGYEER